MKFLPAWLHRLIAWSKPKQRPSDEFPPDRPLTPEEPIVRYAVSSRRISASQGKLKAEAFIPHPHLEMSVFRTLELDHTKTRMLGQTEYADKLSKPEQLLAWGVFEKQALDHDHVRLSIAVRKTDDEMHPRHRDVVGWPSFADDPKMTKAKQKEVALALSEKTTLVMASPPSGNYQAVKA